MERRGFLSLLASAPFLPTLAKAEPVYVAPLTPPPVASNVRHVLRTLVMPFGVDGRFGSSFELAPKGVTRFVACPQAPFSPDRLLVSCLRDVEILNVAQNGEPQLDVSGVPSSVFAATSWGSRLEFQTATPGVEIVLAVLNPHDVPLYFQAAMIGRSFQVEEEPGDTLILGPNGMRLDFDDEDDFESDFDDEDEMDGDVEFGRG